MAIARNAALEPWSPASDGGQQRAGTMPKSAASLDFGLVTNSDGLEALEPEWNTLWCQAEEAGRLFLSFNWVWHWCQHYRGLSAPRLAIVTGRHRGRLVMVWPLVMEHRLGFATASFLGAPVSQYGDILLDRADPRHEAWLQEGWAFITGQLAPDIVLLRKVRADSTIARFSSRLGGRQTNLQAAPYITLSGEADFAEVDQRWPAKERKNRRRKRNRLGDLGEVGFRRSKGTPATLQAMAQALAWKREWLDRGGLLSAALADRKFDAFFASVLGSTGRPVGAETFELTLDGRPIAIKIAVSSGSYRGMHLTAYDRSLEKCSPGSLLVEEMIGSALRDGVTTLDFLAPVYPYKLEWATGSVSVADHCFPVSAAGALYQGVYLQRLRPRLQRFASTGPIPLRRLASRVLSAHCKTSAPEQG